MKMRRRSRNKFKNAKINPEKFHISQMKFYAFLIPMAAFMVLPIVFVLNNAFKPVDELFLWPPRFFVQRPTLQHFRALLNATAASNIPASRYMFNTLVVTLLAIVITLTISVAAGYALSKKEFTLKKILFEINTVALMFVSAAVMVPRFLIIMNIGLANSFWANIVPIVVTPVGVFLIKQFIDTNVPDTLIEAARIDGANDVYILWKIVVPLASPALATVAIMIFQTAWGYVEASMLFIEDDTYKTFAYYIATFLSPDGGMRVAVAGMSAAAGMLMFIPNLLIFIFMQSRVMNTMAHSGIK